MRVISFRRLREFYEQYLDAQTNLQGWNKVTEAAAWKNFADVRQSFNSADQVGRLTVFDIGGNKYRLITYIDYKKQRVYIRAVLTHKRYDIGQWKNDKWFEE
jgi:mRNA interferase HigB